MNAFDAFALLGLGVFIFGLSVAFLGYKLGYMNVDSHTHQPE